MKKSSIILLIGSVILVWLSINLAGFGFGMPGAVKKRVEKLDEKILVEKKKDKVPTVSITNPVADSTVSGTISITVDASDDNGIDKVIFYIDGVSKSTDTSSPYSYSWDTTAESDGSHTIKAVAHDTVNQTASDQHTVTVSNAHELPDTGQYQSYTTTFGEDHDYQPAASQPSYTDNGDGTITDNRTGLMWLKDTDDWYGGFTEWWENALSNCESFSYAGYSDWRLPNVRELESIINAGEGSSGNKAINTTYFLNTKSSRYWTSTTYVPDNSFAWFVTFSGNDRIVDSASATKNVPYYVRPVRGGPSGDNHELPDTGQYKFYNDTVEISSPSAGEAFYGQDAHYNPTASSPSYTNNGDGTITDNLTGLMWLQEGNYPFNGATSTGTWEQALTYCEGLSSATYTDWRLPNERELMSIVDYGTSSPAINTTYFLNTQLGLHWTSTTERDDSFKRAWCVNFFNGAVSGGSVGNKTDIRYVRPVRGGP